MRPNHIGGSAAALMIVRRRTSRQKLHIVFFAVPSVSFPYLTYLPKKCLSINREGRGGVGGVGEGGVRGGDEGDEGEMKGVRKNPVRELQ